MFYLGFSKIATLLKSILKKSFLPTLDLLSTCDNNNKIVGSNGRNNRKSANFNFINIVRRVEKPCFLTLKTR